MPRPLRVAPGGVCFHVINRGGDRARVFHAAQDYDYFMYAVQRTQEYGPVDLFAACLMPNHFHLVLRPRGSGDLARWMQRLTSTHVRWHHGRAGTSGPVWQGRYKAFPIEQDEHLFTVMRYVERNALRAGLVETAESWRWGSLCWRLGGPYATLLASAPIELPHRWAEFVNSAQTTDELHALRVCVNRERPFGSEAWVLRAAGELGLDCSLTARGRPRKRDEKGVLVPGKGA